MTDTDTIPNRRFWQVNRLVAAELVTLCVLAALPVVLADHMTVFLTRVLLLCLLALSFDLAWGYGGVMSFGQALFFGAAGYAGGLLTRELGVTSVFAVMPLAVLVGMGLAAAVGALILLAKQRPAMIVVALGTLSGAFIAERLFRGWYWAGGQNGVAGLPYLDVLGREIAEGVPFYYLAFACVIVVYAASRALVRSQFGLTLAAARQNEERTVFLGAPVQVMKLIVFVFAGGVAGLGGGLYAFHEGFVGPVLLGVALSTKAVIYVLLGGTGTLIGAVLGVLAIEVTGYLLADRFASAWPILLGCILLAVILIKPSGLIGLISSDAERAGRFGIRSGRGR
ncbi:branched-chain amino acid ABC transporter permease [Celeribacter sp.]|uniref:branched-chain amino acid ABC transporter permease n=1 Tax=Celeribacter sp. TaxID=1890673 RepID=UPI003A918FD3